MTSPPPEAQLCTVCDNTTTQACSGCKISYFCSIEHQKLIWPTHRFFCRSEDKTIFGVPPLSESEIGTLQNARDVVFHDGPHAPTVRQTLLQTIHSLGLFSGSWSSFLSIVANRNVSGSSIGDRHQAACIFLARVHLGSNVGFIASQFDKASTAWNMLAYETAQLFTSCDAKTQLASHDTNPFRLLMKVFQQHLIGRTISLQAISTLGAMRTDLWVIALSRELEVGDKVETEKLNLQQQTALAAHLGKVRLQRDNLACILEYSSSGI